MRHVRGNSFEAAGMSECRGVVGHDGLSTPLQTPAPGNSALNPPYASISAKSNLLQYTPKLELPAQKSQV